MRMIHTMLMAQRRGTKESLDEGEEASERASLRLNIKNTKIMASTPIIAWQIEGEKMEVVTDFLFLGSKIIGMVTAAMKSDGVCFLAGKL